MTTIKTTIRDGRIKLDEPINFPEGSDVEVVINLLPAGSSLRGMTEEEQGDTPEAIARWIQLAEAAPAPVISDEAWEKLEQRRLGDREWQRANAADREKRLQSYLE